MATFSNSLRSLLLVWIFMTTVFANSKMVAYWGQQSASNEQNLAYYCQDDTYDIIVIGFVYLWPTAPGSNYPGMNFAGHCETSFDSANPFVLNCPSIGTDIKYCQQQGKQVLISLGGGVGNYGFTSAAQGTTFADTVWGMFLGGSSTYRPFGDAIVDGVDLDIEGGSTIGYTQFISALRTYFASASKPYYISSAPQCVYPDGRLGPGAGTALTTSWFDYVWVQFYNNYCGLNAYGVATNGFNFNSWANWAATMSVNPNVKVFIGAPASSSAAGSGYVSAAQLQTIATAVAAQYPNVFGGVMVWDAGTAASNNGFGATIGSFLHAGSSSSKPSSTSTTGAAKPSSTSTTGAAKPSSTSTTGAAKPSSTSSTTGSKTHSSTSTSTTGSAMPSTSTSTSTTGSTSNACSNLGAQRCSGTQYQICSNGQWSAAQTCLSGLACITYDDSTVYCGYAVSDTIDSSSSSSTTGDSSKPIPTSTSTSTTGAASSSSSSTSSTSPCSLGDQRCTSTSTYQTCSPLDRNGNTYWAATQACGSGLTCTASATGTNIYCL